jgi:SAM-dependent methyltransferase
VNSTALGGTDTTWERLAQSDPLWAILSDPAKRGGGWRTEDFFATGVAEVAELMDYISTIAPHLSRERAIDFGCGVGRVTLPLSRDFVRVTGIDISPTMLGAARSYQEKYGDTSGACDFILNTGTTLDGFPDASCDLVYSSITLQHIPAPAALGYLAEFIRVLKPGAVAIFQLPARRRPSLKARAGWLFPQAVRAKRFSGIEMHGVLRGNVLSALAMAGGEVVDVQRDSSAGPEWESYRYAVTKR